MKLGRSRPLVICAALIGGLLLAGSHADARGVFASGGVDIWSKVTDGGKVTVLSPDRRSRVTARYGDTGLVLRMSGAAGKFSFVTDKYVASELRWSPDSKAFFLTGSDGGAVGDYHLLVVDRFSGTLALRDISEAIYTAFGHPVKCDVPEVPNVGGVMWLPGHHILVAAEVLPHSVCDSMGTFVAYELDPFAMKVIRSYGQLEAKKLFAADLGSGLIGHSQNITVAAMQMADMKVWAHRS